jgi:DMSO/TMAO reductase YedYZ molybdopterin-dependent catalytic subunit
LAVAARLAGQYGLIPPDHGGIYGAGTTLTYASQRLLTHQSLAREFPRSEISKAPFAKLRPFKQETFERLRDGGFVDWRVEVGGMVARPTSFSMTDLRSLPSRTQVTQLACEEGWSFIAEWTGVPLSHVLKAAGTPPQAVTLSITRCNRDGGKASI